MEESFEQARDNTINEMEEMEFEILSILERVGLDSTFEKLSTIEA